MVVGVVLLIGLLAACGNGGKVAVTFEPAPTPTAAAAQTSAQAPAPADAERTRMQWSSPPEMVIDPEKRYFATMRTNKGVIEIELYPKETPNTVNNFIFLARQGFYDGTPFHRVIKGFMLQGGDPTGTGTGGPGYRFDDEPVTRDYTRGILAMANSGPNTNGSQFFIMHQNYALPKNYIIFGQVTDGFDVVDAMANTPVRSSGSGEASVPTESLTVESIEIREE
jgi:cyclophilin family peptidyl-prolyl cis-trans isomerase